MNNTYYYEDNYGITLKKHMAKTFLWVFLGLLVTTISAFVSLYSGLFLVVYSSSLAYILVAFAQLGVVMYLSSRLYHMSYTSAIISYFLYSLLTGFTLSSILLVYTGETIVFAFALAAILFLDLAFIGYRTNVDLSKFSGLFMGGIIALLIASLVGVFFSFSAFDTFICFIGIVLFLGITAWDTQKMKQYYYHYQNNPEVLQKLSIYSALELYLDFINIFLYIIRLMSNGRRRD